MTDLRSDLAFANDSALVGYTAGGSDVERTVERKLRERRSINDFMKVARTVSAAFELAQDSINTGFGEIELIDIYDMDAPIVPRNGVHWIGRGATLRATYDNQVIMDVSISAYAARFLGINFDGNGHANVTSMRLRNTRIYSVIRDCRFVDLFRAIALLDGCFGLMIDNLVAQRVPYPIEFTENASAATVLGSNLDNGPSQYSGGMDQTLKNKGVGIYIGANSNSCIRVLGGYIQNFKVGVEDHGVGSEVRAYFKTNTTSDILGQGARHGRYVKCDFLAAVGPCAIKLRNCDGMKIEDPVMASGARPIMFDIDFTNTNTYADWQDSNASFNSPTGDLSYVNRMAAQGSGSFTPSIVGSSTAGTASYSAQLGR